MAEDISSRVAWALKKALTPKSTATNGGRGRATFVRRDEGGTAWVRIPGNDFDTPVAGGVAADAEPGDSVLYDIENGRVSITGNSTSPSVGERFVGRAIDPVRQSVAKMGNAVASSVGIAQAAQRVADAINQHFWTDTSGIHVTEVTQDEWEDSTGADYHSGANVLINSFGQLFRDGMNNLLAIVAGTDPGMVVYDGDGNASGNVIARLLSSGAQIGRDSGMHVSVDSNSVDVSNGSAELITMRATGGSGFIGKVIDHGTYIDLGSGMTVDAEDYIARTIIHANTSNNYSDIDIENDGSTTEMYMNGMDLIKFSDPYDVDGNYLQLGKPSRYANSGSYRITTAGIDTYTNGPSVTLPAGSYVIVGAWIFQAGSSSGSRNLQLAFRSGSSGSLWGERERVYAAASNYAILNITALRTLTSTTTVYLAGSSSMTTGSAGDAWITAQRLN